MGSHEVSDFVDTTSRGKCTPTSPAGRYRVGPREIPRQCGWPNIEMVALLQSWDAGLIHGRRGFDSRPIFRPAAKDEHLTPRCCEVSHFVKRPISLFLGKGHRAYEMPPTPDMKRKAAAPIEYLSKEHSPQQAPSKAALQTVNLK